MKNNFQAKVNSILDKIITRETHKGTFQRIKIQLLEEISALALKEALEALGEDEYTTYLKDQKYKKCPQCQVKEGMFHRVGCRVMEEMFKNRIKKETRENLKKKFGRGKNE